MVFNTTFNNISVKWSVPYRMINTT